MFGERIGVIVVPVMASEVQFLLVDEINRIRSVGVADFGGRFEWKFGRPLARSRLCDSAHLAGSDHPRPACPEHIPFALRGRWFAS